MLTSARIGSLDWGGSPTLTVVGCHWGTVNLTSARIGSLNWGDSPTLTVVGCHWGPVILTSARIGSPGPGRFPYSHCGCVPLKPSNSDFSQNWKPRAGEIPLLSLWLGAIEAQWIWLQPELETRDQGETHTLTAVGCHWGPVNLTSARIGRPGRDPYSHCGWVPLNLTSARIGSPGPGRLPYSHCGWVPLEPSDSDFSLNWKPRTGEIPLLSLWLGAIEAQWIWLQPELETRDQGETHTLTVVGCHWGPVILTSARIGSLGPGRFPYSHCSWVPLMPSDSDFSQNWKPGTGEIPLLSLWLGAVQAQWFWLQPELEAWDQGNSPTLTVVGHHWGPVILISARIGCLGPGRFPLLSMQLGAIDAQWFWLRPELEAWYRGETHTLTAVGCHWGPVILTSARIGSPGPGREPYSHCSWVPLSLSDSDFSQNWKPGTREIPLLSLQLGAIEAQWFWLQPELEAQDRVIPLLFKWSMGSFTCMKAIHTSLSLW
jgi:hypothetical protein